MSLLFFDTPTPYTHQSGFWKRWDGFTTLNPFSLESDRCQVANINRHGEGSGWSILSTGVGRGPTYGFQKFLTEVIFGVSFYISEEQDTVADSLIQFAKNGINDKIQVGLSEFNDIFLYKNLEDIVYESAFKVKNQNWNFLEGHIGFHSSTGFFTCRLNNKTLFTVSGLNTNDNRDYINSFRLFAHPGQNDGASNGYISEVYIIDPTDGVYPTGFLGDCRIDTLFPTGDGSVSNFIGSDGNSVNNFDNITGDFLPSFTDKYNQSTGVGDQDLYTYENLKATAGTIHGVASMVYARKEHPGFRTGYNLIRTSGTTYTGERYYPSTDPWYHVHVFGLNPFTSVNWTEAEINQIEAGNQVGE